MAFDLPDKPYLNTVRAMFHRLYVVIPIFRPARVIGCVDDVKLLQRTAHAFLAEGHYIYADFEHVFSWSLPNSELDTGAFHTTLQVFNLVRQST